ncbi:MAG TPA: DUF4252 domain-containing protein [Pyrinomonadaceae bacterium]|nr:DUF4252 domain-containing protein [Pyrinomonadaceae bacterium]
MKSSAKTTLKLALLVVFVVLGTTATTMAQNARIQTSQLEALAAKASETVDVNLDEKLLALAGGFLGNDPDDRKVREIVSGLKGIYVKSFEFETEGMYSAADLESIRSQLRNASWTRIVNVSSKKEGSVEVYLMQTGSQIGGLALLATDPKEITVVNIVGPVDLAKLSQMEGNFGIPELGIDKPKVKKN